MSQYYQAPGLTTSDPARAMAAPLRQYVCNTDERLRAPFVIGKTRRGQTGYSTFLTGLQISRTAYVGHEKKILQFRNDNRGDQKSLTYMDWRYQGYPARRQPDVFWVTSSRSEPIAMAALVYRPYWIDGADVDVGILGDICVRKEYRGKGVAQELFHFIREHLVSNALSALVLPNLAAQRSLQRSGWKTVAYFRSWISILDVEKFFSGNMGSRIFGRAVGFVTRSYIRTRGESGGFSVEEITSLGKQLQRFSAPQCRKGLVIRNQDRKALEWRYDMHPEVQYRKFAVLDKGTPIAIAVYRDALGSQCQFMDLVLQDAEDCISVIRVLVAHLIRHLHPVAVRMVVNAGNPLESCLLLSKFFPRPRDGAIMGWGTLIEESISTCKWSFTSGDKDV